MPEQFEKFLGDLKEILNRLLSFLSPQQKRLVFIGLPLFGAIAYAALFSFDRMNYGPLFTNVAPQDGAAIVKELDAAKIPYTLSGGGTIIEVPRGLVYQTRLKLAGKGVPAGGGVGFEIFEKTSFGVSEFTQQVNYLRALQGELARTVNSIAAVQSSRIHLAIPSRTNFLGPEEKPSASVVVDLRPGYHLSGDQVHGIVNLVASSVPKLSADKVTVIDSSGRPLKEIVLASAGSEAEKFNALKIKYEQEMQRRVETLLEPVLGPGKAVVRANVLLNLQETQMTKEEFDPENRIVRSQRQVFDEGSAKGGGAPGVQSNIPGGDAAKTAAPGGPKRGSEIVTYEIGHTLSKIAEPRGQIQKLSVAVLVDGKYEKDKYIARSAEEIEVIKGVVKRAVGFDGERGDEIEIANVPFKVQPGVPLPPVAVPDLKDMLMSPLGIGVAAGVLLAIGALAFFLTRGRGKKTAAETPAAIVEAVKAAAAVPETAEETPIVPKKIVLIDDPRKEQLGQIARDYHDATVRIIRGWLQEDASKVYPSHDNGTGVEELH
ncbi:MAG: flagellar basal-body MS-ring/collar protein FliF [Deltaproteobacteria bacterium]|nr:flagellar basal-body MS-ring/collar protein FliF [Deltaproteobacteria bacterium]MDZ4340819.1 flagellar basal-body MS-ring/collar protein FliF [Candidatus Binatia bacterium]